VAQLRQSKRLPSDGQLFDNAAGLLSGDSVKESQKDVVMKKYSEMFHVRKHGQIELAVDLQDLDGIRAWLVKANIRCLVDQHSESGVAILQFGSRVSPERLQTELKKYEDQQG